MRILITGASGEIGSELFNRLQYDFKIRAIDRNRNVSGLCDDHVVDTGSIECLIKATRGVHTVIHLAGERSPKAEWSKLVSDNLDYSHRLFEAMSISSCKRLIFASSVHVVEGYVGSGIADGATPMPTTDYGVSKASVEAMALRYKMSESWDVCNLRLGAYKAKDTWSFYPELSDRFLDPEDFHTVVSNLLLKNEWPTHLNVMSDRVGARLDVAKLREFGAVPTY